MSYVVEEVNDPTFLKLHVWQREDLPRTARETQTGVAIPIEEAFVEYDPNDALGLCNVLRHSQREEAVTGASWPPTCIVVRDDCVRRLCHELGHAYIRRRLEEEFGASESGWWRKGVPEKVRVELASAKERDCEVEEPYSCTTFIQLSEIIEHNWALFSDVFGTKVWGGHQYKTRFKTFVELNRIRWQRAHGRAPLRRDVTVGMDERRYSRTPQAVHSFARL